MTAQTFALTDFLLARIADDEERARFVWSQLDEYNKTHRWEQWRLSWHDEYDLLCIEPDRAIAECEARRGIVEIHQLANADQGGGVGCMHCDWDREWGMPTTGGCDTLRYLAAGYTTHPEYREEWRV